MTSSMRILHISETDYEGGAGRAAHTLHTALRRQGIESFFLTECARTDDPWTFTFSGRRGMVAKGLRHLRATLDLLPLRRYPRRQTGAWSIGWLPRLLPPLVRRLRPDFLRRWPHCRTSTGAPSRCTRSTRPLIAIEERIGRSGDP